MKKTFKVKGLHCKSCEMIIKDLLLELKGVKNIDVSFKKNTVAIDYDERKVNKEMIKKIIEKKGYKINE